MSEDSVNIAYLLYYNQPCAQHVLFAVSADCLWICSSQQGRCELYCPKGDWGYRLSLFTRCCLVLAVIYSGNIWWDMFSDLPERRPLGGSQLWWWWWFVFLQGQQELTFIYKGMVGFIMIWVIVKDRGWKSEWLSEGVCWRTLLAAFVRNVSPLYMHVIL